MEGDVSVIATPDRRPLWATIFVAAVGLIFGVLILMSVRGAAAQIAMAETSVPTNGQNHPALPVDFRVHPPTPAEPKAPSAD